MISQVRFYEEVDTVVRSTAVPETRNQLRDESEASRRRFVQLGQEERQHNREDEILRAIVEGTASSTGDEFFRSLVSNLADVLRVRYTFVSEFVGKNRRVRTLAFWTGEGFLENFEYDLADTPCEQVLSGEACHYSEGVQALFPKDKDLVDLEAESYLAIPLMDVSGNVLGHLAALDNKPMAVELRSMSIFRIFGARAGSELARKQAEETVEHELKVAQALLREAKERVEGPLLGESPAVRGLREMIARYAETNGPLLVTGPRGVGHEAVARAIHHQSDRAKRAFIHVDCAVLQTSEQSTLLESAPRDVGSSTRSKGGRFDLADGGTLYLDGVNELSPPYKTS